MGSTIIPQQAQARSERRRTDAGPLGARPVTLLLVGVPALVLQLLVPSGGATFGERLAHFLAPDAYWSNASINGAVSRLALSDGWPLAAVPVAPRAPAFLAPRHWAV